MVKKIKENILDSKIRIVIWKLKTGKSKKECCEFLGISYNTTRLDRIIKEFKEREEREKSLKEKAKIKQFSSGELQEIAKSYTEGESISKIAERYYVSFSRIKKLLIDNSIPIRSRGVKKSAQVDHIIQDLDSKFSIGDTVFIPGPTEDEYINKNKALIKVKNTYGLVEEIYDEDYIDKITDGYIREKQLFNWSKLEEGQKPIEGIHYEVYWYLNNGKCWGKLNAFKIHLLQIENHLSNYGRESYKVWINDKKYSGFYWFRRDELYPVGIQGGQFEI